MRLPSGCLLIFSLFTAFGEAKEAPHPFVVLPPALKWNATNSITVTPMLRDARESVNAEITVRAGAAILYSGKAVWEAGAPTTLTFKLTSSPEWKKLPEVGTVSISLTRHSLYAATILLTPDLRTIHVFTDKVHYKAGEKVTIRALPLTYDGLLYAEPVELLLINPARFELQRKTAKALEGKRFVQSEFLLPTHLHYGEWRIEARSIGSHSVFGTAFFKVHDFSLPPFEATITVTNDGASPNAVPVTVTARYSYGAALSGSLSLYCQAAEKQLERRPMKQAELSAGSWSGVLDTSRCADNATRAMRLIAEIRDSGTGSRVETSTTFDPTAPRFELIPLRPAVGKDTRSLLLLVADSVGDQGAVKVTVNARCLKKNGSPMNELNAEANIGDTVEVQLPEKWKECLVVSIKARRRLSSSSLSRPRSLLLPVLDVSTMPLSWIKPASKSATYKVDDLLTVSIPTRISSSKANYMIHCNGRDLIQTAAMPSNGLLNLKITREMRGHCLLAVFLAKEKTSVDVMMFFVKEDCQHSVSSISDTAEPGQTVDLVLKAPGEGIALLSAIDDRLNWLAAAKPITYSSLYPLKAWDLTAMFNHSGLDSSLPTSRLANLVDVKAVARNILVKCSDIGSAYMAQYSSCPEGVTTTSHVSDLCLRMTLKACTNLREPDVMKACGNRVGGTGCMAGGAVAEKAIVKAASAPFAFKGISNAAVPATLDDAPVLKEKEEDEKAITVRKHLPHVWIFDDFEIEKSGSRRLSLNLPHNIGRWAIGSAFWSRGEKELCPAKSVYLTVVRKYFLQVDMPQAAYLNESVSVSITVTGERIEEDITLSVCQSVARTVCSDEGVGGQAGNAVFSRIVLTPSSSISTKTIAMRFLDVGTQNISFFLRKETNYPGRHHCEVGELFDAVEFEIQVQKRAETEEHYKGLILTVDKPVIDENVLNDFSGGSEKAGIIQVREYRRAENPNSLYTEVYMNLLDTETVYSFTVEIARFLVTHPPEVDTTALVVRDGRRSKRSTAVEYGNAFLTDAIKQLSVTLFRQELLRASPEKNFQQLEHMDNAISSLISDLLRFSDCTDKAKPCAFGQTGRPTKADQHSVVLSSLATSLLCKAAADPKLVCGSLSFLHNRTTSGKIEDENLQELVDISSHTDRLWFVRSLLLQVSVDCAAYECLSQTNTWGALYRSFYRLDDRVPLDNRVVASLAALATPSTRSVMRGRLSTSLVRVDIAPFWTAGERRVLFDKTRLRGGAEVPFFLSERNKKSGDILMNSLALIAFIDHETEMPTNFDLLADWIDEQRESDEFFGNAMDTYFAARALAAYGVRKGIADEDYKIEVEIKCNGCAGMRANVTDASPLFYIPTTAKNITIITSGMGKARAGIRLLSTKRHRARRGSDNKIRSPVDVTVDQAKVGASTITQIVCIKPNTPLVRTVEVTHGLFTGYTTTVDKFEIYQNSTTHRATLVAEPFISSYALHVVLTDLVRGEMSCYKIGLAEPLSSHEPGQLAPVAVTAKHATYDIVGEAIIVHPDVSTAAMILRAKRSLNLILPDNRRVVVLDWTPPGKETKSLGESMFWPRRKRSLEDPIDSVCFDGGRCSCSERSCSVNCIRCEQDMIESAQEGICYRRAFGATVELANSVNATTTNGDVYTQLELNVLHWHSQDLGKPKNLTAWLRPCNRLCISSLQKDKNYILLGDVDGVIADENAKMHYVLRDTDYFIPSQESCLNLISTIIFQKCTH